MMVTGKPHRIIFILTALFQCWQINAQDIHFSQFFASPQNLNPSLTGSFDGQYRMVINNRNQWQSFTNGYRTFSASSDCRIRPLIVPPAWSFGAGLLVNSDKAGDGNMGLTQLGISLATHHDITGTGKYIISAGICPSFLQYSIDFSKLTFNSQYNGINYDSNILSNENFAGNSITFFDLSSGINLAALLSAKISLTMGFAANHMLKPQISFNNDPSVRLNPKYQYHALAMLSFRDDLIIYPSILFATQGKQKEFNWGGMVRIGLKNLYFQSLYFGSWNRWNDAIILKTGTDYQNINIGISYDINISKLTKASNGRGGFEFSMAYIFNMKKEQKPLMYKHCPTFI